MIPGAIIKQWVKDSGLTLERAAELCDVSLRTLEYWRKHHCAHDHKADPLKALSSKNRGQK